MARRLGIVGPVVRESERRGRTRPCAFAAKVHSLGDAHVGCATSPARRIRRRYLLCQPTAMNVWTSTSVRWPTGSGLRYVLASPNEGTVELEAAPPGTEAIISFVPGERAILGRRMVGEIDLMGTRRDGLDAFLDEKVAEGFTIETRAENPRDHRPSRERPSAVHERRGPRSFRGGGRRGRPRDDAPGRAEAVLNRGDGTASSYRC